MILATAFQGSIVSVARHRSKVYFWNQVMAQTQERSKHGQQKMSNRKIEV